MAFRLQRFLADLPAQRARHLGTLLVVAAIVGVAAGLGAIAFYWLLDAARWLFLEQLAGWHPSHPGGEAPLFPESTTPLRRWLLLILPAAGGLVSGLIVFRLAPEAEGHGTDAAIEAYHHRRGEIRARVPFVKAIASAITIGTGGSAGREGPIAQIGAGIASNLADRLGLTRRDRAVLMAAGMAGGIGAIFHAPLAGAIFSAEVMYRELDLEHEVLWPAFISSIVAYSVFAMKFGWSPLFVTPSFTFHDPVQLVPYLALALVLAVGAWIFIRVFYGVRDAFRRLRAPAWSKPALGGLVVGLIGFFIPDALATGYGVLQDALFLGDGGSVLAGQEAARLALGHDAATLSVVGLLVLAGARMVTTAFSIGSGGSGGVFGPAVLVGGSLGGAVGLVAADVFPGAGIQPGAFVIVGMAGFFAAAGHVPLSTIIMVAEMTGNYHLLVPSMLACIVAFLLVGQRSLFENQLESRLDAPAKRGHMMSAVLRAMSVRDAMGCRKDTAAPLIPGSTSLSDLLDLVASSGHECFPVVDAEEKLVGVVDGRTIRFMLQERDSGDVLLAIDLCSPPETLTGTESLQSAMAKMRAANREELIIVDERDESKVLGTLSLADVMAAYDQEMSQRLK